MTGFALEIGEAAMLDTLVERLGQRRDGALTLTRLAANTLLVTKTVAPVVSGPAGAVVGDLYQHDAGCAPETDADRVADRLSRGPDALLKDYWGRYVAIGRGPGDGYVLREPSGAIPVNWIRSGKRLRIFSDLTMLQAIDPVALEPDFDALARLLHYSRCRTSETPVKGVRELLPGCALGLTGSDRAVTAWNPARFSPSSTLDQQQAAERLRETITGSGRALLSRYRTPLLELSGGLDSSVLAVALAPSCPEMTAATLVADAAEGDERRYASEAARAAGIPLAALDIGVGSAMTTGSLPLRLRPGVDPVLATVDRIMAGHARRIGADCFVSGIGGDNVFCALSTVAPAIDAAAALGWRAGLRVLDDIAARHDATIWTALGYAARRWTRPRGRVAWTPDPSLLTEAARASPPELHPWLVAAATLPPGTAEHVKLLVVIHDFLDVFPRDGHAPIVRPLYSQPVMEACLAIPSWMWVAGGRDRAVARAAFRRMLPELIVNRRTKGRLEGLYIRAFEQDRAWIADRLRRGRLFAAGILDMAAAETILASPVEVDDTGFFRLLQFLGVEDWLSSLGRPSPA